MKKKRRGRKIRFIKWIFLLWIVYTVACGTIPPFFHKMAADPEAAQADVGQPERVRSIDDNREALLWRLRLIGEAQESVVLCTFDFRDDDSGCDMMAALFDAAERGVDVRIMVDGINGTLYLTASRIFRELAGHENVQVKLYNPINLLMPWKLNYRMHDKYLIADDLAYILGGRNTNNLFLGDYVDSYNEDRDILVYETVPGEGSSYLRLREYFERIWELPCAKVYKRPAYGQEFLNEYYRTVRERYPEAFAGTDWEKETTAAEKVELCTNPMEPVNKPPLLWKRMLRELDQQEDILIQTPYIICSREMYRDLADLSSRGVQIITNAVESGANPFGCTDYLNQKKNIYGTGAHVYERLGTQALHTKTILAGDSISIVGSCNMDMRSIYLDTEMMLVIESGELNRQLREQAEELKKQSRHVYPDGRAEDGENYTPLKQGIGKKILYGVLRVLVIPFRHLL